MNRFLLKFLFCLCFLTAPCLFASPNLVEAPQQVNWAFGVGWGTQTDFDSVAVFEIKTPTLFTFLGGRNRISLVMSYENKNVSGAYDGEITPIHLLFELTGVPYKDIVRSYIRLGGGSVLVDDPVLFPKSNFFNVQVQLGVDLVTGRSEGGLSSSFFMQAMANSPAIRNPPLNNYPDIYDGVSIVAGIRAYF